MLIDIQKSVTVKKRKVKSKKGELARMADCTFIWKRESVLFVITL